MTAESVSGAVAFYPTAVDRDLPVIPTAAGHDAGVLSAAGIPTAMLFVRNPTGVRHSPAEPAETRDCLAGVEALADCSSGSPRDVYLLERAWVDGAVARDVLVEIEDGRFTYVTPGSDVSRFPRMSGEPASVPGLTLPGLTNDHSHAFHRALRGRTQQGRGTFWTWREQMYAVADRLDPDTYRPSPPRRSGRCSPPGTRA